MKPRISRLVTAALLGFASLGFAAETSPNFQFDIPAASLKVAADNFAATVGGDVVFDAYAARDVQTRPVRGQMSPESALDQMLAGTNLYYRYNAAARRVIISGRRN